MHRGIGTLSTRHIVSYFPPLAGSRVLLTSNNCMWRNRTETLEPGEDHELEESESKTQDQHNMTTAPNTEKITTNLHC